MKSPPHPGRVVYDECIEPLGLTITGAAKALGISKNSLSRLINGRNGISAETALRLSKAFGGSAESWLQQQLNYDLARAMKKKGQLKVKRIRAV